MIQVEDRLYIFTDMRRGIEIEGYVKILCYHIDESGDLKYEFEWGERPYIFMRDVRRDFDGKTVIVGANTNTKYVGDYYVAFEPENKRFMPIYPITDEAWELYGHTMLEENKILAANLKYVKVIDGDKVYGTFWSMYDDYNIEPHIRVAAGDYMDLCHKWRKDSALTAILSTIAHEFTHYFQWINALKLTPIGQERQATNYARYILDEYAETREHP